MKTLIIALVTLVSISAFASQDNAKTYSVCRLNYTVGDSLHSTSKTIGTVRFKNDGYRSKSFEIKQTAYTTEFSFDPMTSGILLRATGNSKRATATDLLSTGKSYISLDLSPNEKVAATCETKTLEEAFDDLMFAFDR